MRNLSPIGIGEEADHHYSPPSAEFEKQKGGGVVRETLKTSPICSANVWTPPLSSNFNTKFAKKNSRETLPFSSQYTV